MTIAVDLSPAADIERRRAFAISDLRIDENPWTADITPARARTFLEGALRDAEQGPDFEEIAAFKLVVSMLHQDVLVMLRALAAVTSGAIVEIGPDIGGSTVMFAKGVTSPRQLVVLEPGGAVPNHPHIPTSDILADLETTLSACGVRERVSLVAMQSWREGALDAVKGHLGSTPIGLLSIDADGHVDRDMDGYRPLCAPGCVVVIDDFLGDERDTGKKASIIKPWVTKQVEAGALIQFGVDRLGHVDRAFAGLTLRAPR